MPKEHPDSQKFNFEMEKIRSLLFVKNQKDIMYSIERLESVLDGLLQAFIKKANEAEHLKRSNETLEGVIYRLEGEIRNKVERMEEEASKIEIIKLPLINKDPQID